MTQPADHPPSSPSSATRSQLLAWALFDWANQPFATVVQTFVFAAYFTRHVAADEATGVSQWGTTIGLAGLLIAVSAPILGAAADQGGRRKPWLLAFTLLSVAAMAGLWFVGPSTDFAVLGLALLALGTVTTEFANVFYNAMMPTLAPAGRVGRWSGWGWCAGYLGGLSCLVVALLVFVQPEPARFGLDRDQAEHVRATFLLSAAWLAVFALPLLLWTPDAPGTGKPLRRAVPDGVRQLVTTIRHVRRYRHIVRFLIAKMIYLDGLATVFVFGGVYAAGTFDMTEQQVLLFGIALNVTAALGAAGFAWIDDAIGSRATILVSLVGVAVPAGGILLVDAQAWFWGLGLLLGVFVGPVQAASRSYLARVAPADLRTEMFGLYALSGKATAFAGPLLVGWVTWWTASQRVGMATIVIFFAAGFALLWSVPPTAAEASQDRP